MKKLLFMLVVWGVASVPVLAAPAATAVGSAADAGSAKPVEPTHDTIVSKFDNGSVSRVYYVLHGTEVRDGVSVTYHPNGNVAIEAPYVAGKLDGVFRSYYENGKVWKNYWLQERHRRRLFHFIPREWRACAPRILQGRNP
jgi:Uncharacterized protein conserved in bacteria